MKDSALKSWKGYFGKSSLYSWLAFALLGANKDYPDLTPAIVLLAFLLSVVSWAAAAILDLNRRAKIGDSVSKENTDE